MKHNQSITNEVCAKTIKITPFSCVIVSKNGEIVEHNQHFATLFLKEKCSNIFDNFFLSDNKDNEKNRLQQFFIRLEKNDCLQQIRLMIDKKICMSLPTNNTIISLCIQAKKINAEQFILIFEQLGGMQTTEISQQIDAQPSPRSDFSSILTHEIRTPLNAILNVSQHLFNMSQDDDDPSEEMSEGLQILVQYSQRLNLFLEDLPGFTVLENEKKRMETSFQIKDILPKTQRLFQSLSHDKNLSLEIFSQDIQNNILVGDRLRLYQTFVIITLFITKTFTNGKSTMSFEKKFDEKSLENTLWCKVKISLENATTKNEFYIKLLRDNIKIIGGELLIEYGEKEIKIVFDIPFFIQEIYKNTKNVEEVEKKKPQPTLDKAGLLIIDDEPVGSKILTMMLKKENLMIYKALNGREALQQMEKNSNNIHLVLMDLMLPDTTGYELLQEFKKKYPSLRIIAFSALNEKEEIKKMIDLGFFDYIPKPFTEQDLENIIELIK